MDFSKLLYEINSLVIRKETSIVYTKKISNFLYINRK